MKQYLKFFLIVALSVATVNCNTGQTQKSDKSSVISEVLDPPAFNEQMTGQVIVDVRTPAEFKSGYIEGAVNIDFSKSTFKSEMAKLDKEKPVYLYCRSGKRSAAAAKQLSAMGFSEVYDLKGGILNWQKKSLELNK